MAATPAALARAIRVVALEVRPCGIVWVDDDDEIVTSPDGREEPVRVDGVTVLAREGEPLDVAADEYSRPETRDEARMLLRALIGQRLHGQVLHTRVVLRELADL